MSSAQASSVSHLWELARAELRQRAPDAVFWEGSLAEGFGNDKSDVDFVGIVDDGTELPTMPYILFAEGRRIEVRLLSSAKLRSQLGEVRQAVQAGPEAMAQLSWDLLDRCHRFLGCIPLANEALIRDIQRELEREQLKRAVAHWFEDFSRQSGRYAVALHVLFQPDYAFAWMRTAALHAAKSWAAKRGETYIGLKWLSLQLARAQMPGALSERLFSFMRRRATSDMEAHLREGAALLSELGVSGVEVAAGNVLLGSCPGVTSWQIGERIHVVRGSDLFALSEQAGQVWRSVVWDTPCESVIQMRGPAEAASQGNLLSGFQRSGLLSLTWKGGGTISARRLHTVGPPTTQPLISVDGARVAQGRDISLLPMSAQQFAEAGMEMTWANIGLENAREDAEGALSRDQWQVLGHSVERMAQMACLVALGAHGVTPAPPLEEATLEAIRLLQLERGLAESIRALETAEISDAASAQKYFGLANEVASALRKLAGEPQFPKSFESASGWRGTLLLGYDWINLMAHIQARFPMTGPGGRGTLEEARDVLAASAH